MVTQKPPVLTVSKGDTATMDCNHGTVTDSGCSVGTSRFQVEFLSLCCISTALPALPHMELDSPPVTSLLNVRLILTVS